MTLNEFLNSLLEERDRSLKELNETIKRGYGYEKIER